jgi:hypothetical protein
MAATEILHIIYRQWHKMEINGIEGMIYFFNGIEEIGINSNGIEGIFSSFVLLYQQIWCRKWYIAF